MKKIFTKNNLIRLIYIFCFYMFCWIDQICGSRNGRIQMVAVNCVGFFVAIIIFSNFKFKDFLKWEYLVWLIICLIGAPLLIMWGKENYNYIGQWSSAVLEGVVYGFIIIRLVKYYYGEKHKIYEHFDKWALILIGTIFALMVISRNESIWYVYYFMVFGSLMLTPMTKERQEILSDSMSTGVLLGYIMIQGHAFVFRPYDIVRYNGFYTNPNMNALIYVAGFVAIFCKIYKMKAKNSKLIWRLLMYAFAGLTVGFAVYTGCRTALLTMAGVYFVFMLRYVQLIPKKKINRFTLLCVLMVTMIVVMVYPAYCAIRYIPPVFHHPIWLDGDYYYAERVHSWDEWDSEKYVSFEEAMKAVGIHIEQLVVKAAGEDEFIEKPGSSAENPLYSYDEYNTFEITEKRYYIYKWYLSQLNFFGHKTNNGVWLHKFYFIYHAHDMYLQLAYNYGILLLALFVGLLGYFFVKGKKTHNVYELMFIVAFLIFGSLEVTWNRGQILFIIALFSQINVFRNNQNIMRSESIIDNNIISNKL